MTLHKTKRRRPCFHRVFSAAPRGANVGGISCGCALRSARGAAGLLDERGHCGRLRFVDRVAALGFDHGRSCALGHGALSRRRNHLVVGRNQVKAALALPSGLVNRAVERSDTPGHLRIRPERRELRVEIGRKGCGKLGESLLRIHQKLDTFQGQSRFTTWAATIAVNCALSELRRRRYQHVSLDDAAEQADWSTGDEHASEAQIEALRRGIQEALTERQREAIEAALGGLPLMELARRQGVSQGAIYKLLHDARRRLKGYLEASGHSHGGGPLQETLA
jgi:RNA polymerase sigma factor (sigma-70 family)